MTEHPELRKGRRPLFIPVKDNNVGKELGAASISRRICTSIVNSHATPGEYPRKGQTHEVCAVATPLQLFNKVDLQAVMKTGPFVATGETITIFS